MPTFFLDPEFLARLGSIVVIDLVLAGDNAVVIALAVRSLPARQQLFGRLFGTAGAVVLRVALIALATVLLTIPLMQLAGGLALVWIAIKLVRPMAEEETLVRPGRSLYQAVGIIMFADLVMSLDNVLGVAAAAHGDLSLVVFGIGLSVPIVVFGSSLVSRLMARFTWVVWVGGGVLGYVAGEMLCADPLVQRWLLGLPALGYLVSLALAAGITAVGWWGERARRSRIRQPAVSL